ncbi:hypothetical protein TcCL_NonESM09954 [Trypanosoma cruzi]|nr:hypothetical protein TcCL_NonESM09954 [Trypanosoma cruzi]
MLPAPFLTPPQSLLPLFPLLSSSQARHSHFNTRPSSKGSPSCAPAAPQCSPPPPPSQTAPCPPRPHNRRHATAAQHPQRHNVVPPLLRNHERNTQRVLAHVLHALQPPTDQVGRHAQHLVVFLVLGADSHTSRSTAWVLREAADRSSVCGRSKCAEKKATLTPSRISTHSTRPHKRAVPWGREVRRTAYAQKDTQQQRHPRRTPTKRHAHSQTHGCNERGAAHPNPRRCSLLLTAATDWIGVPHSQ